MRRHPCYPRFQAECLWLPSLKHLIPTLRRLLFEYPCRPGLFPREYPVPDPPLEPWNTSEGRALLPEQAPPFCEK